MPTVSRSRTVPAPPERVWTLVADPQRLAEWWPRVQRVEEATGKAWTAVLTSPKGGKALRADYTLVASDHPRRRSWRHEVAASPFERVLVSSETVLRLEPAGEDSTAVELTETAQLRGVSMLGGLQFRRATARKLDEALDGIERHLAEAVG
jgi:uncharacterized protein YndB with AHSA1/START domain